MKCFMHASTDAVAVCKQCGKAMCFACSAYNNHSGICPECKREEYEAEERSLTNYINNADNMIAKIRKTASENKKKEFIIGGVSIGASVVLGVALGLLITPILFALLAVGGIVGGVCIYKGANEEKNAQPKIDAIRGEITPKKERLVYVKGEIKKLKQALQQGQGEDL